MDLKIGRRVSEWRDIKKWVDGFPNENMGKLRFDNKHVNDIGSSLALRIFSICLFRLEFYVVLISYKAFVQGRGVWKTLLTSGVSVKEDVLFVHLEVLE